MDWKDLFQRLLKAETEARAIQVLASRGLWEDRSAWLPLGGIENNFGTVSNQQTDPTGALVEKVINSIDATLMAACHAAGIDPESSTAPRSMTEAVARFFSVPDGRLGGITPTELTKLADAIHVIATGSKTQPSYLIVDRGEGQSPESFPDTFLSLAKSNKLRIPFVQGRFNSGGTGVLQFCGRENLQLIASRRHPQSPTRVGDPTSDMWGFTIVRRLEPEDQGRRNSMYVYLAPGGEVPRFAARSVPVLPGESKKNEPGAAYTAPLQYGTVVKLYDYRWRAKSLATTEARFELEKYLHSPALPFRVTETRAYRANYYSTTVSGIWASVDAGGSDGERQRVERGFPATATLDLPGIGPLRYRLVVFDSEVDPRRIPHGVFFSVNGQVQGSLGSDFIGRSLEFEYLRNHLLVSMDCTGMQTRVREDFFMASRDRLRQDETYDTLVGALRSDLKQHPGLRALNAARRARALQKTLGEQEDVVRTFDELLRMDPSLRALFLPGDRLVTKVGPSEAEQYKGLRFPTFFRIAGEPKNLVKECPANRQCYVEFETDAVNDYFDRDNSPGSVQVSPGGILEYSNLWNGNFLARFRPPPTAPPGADVVITVVVTDLDRESRGKPAFRSQFTLRVGQPQMRQSVSGGTKKARQPGSTAKEAPRLAVPWITEVHKTEWRDYDPVFTEYETFRILRSGEGGFDFLLNVDNAYLISELTRAREADHDLVRYWFKWGVSLCGMGLLQHFKRVPVVASSNADGRTNDDKDFLVTVNTAVNGVASVIVPVIRNLYRGPA